MPPFVRSAPLLLAASAALAQTAELPKDLHGRWTAAPSAPGGRAVTQPFDLENIQRKDGDTFAARLSWMSPDAKCTIRYQPITGRVTSSGLKFESKSPCNEAWTAELARGAGGWVGKASTKADPPTTVDLTAK